MIGGKKDVTALKEGSSSLTKPEVIKLVGRGLDP